MTRDVTRREMIAATGALVVLVACGRGERRAVGPQPIAIGLDECAWCRMLIDEERLAAQFVAADGRASSFGEAGCLLAWLAANPGAAGRAYVRTLDGGNWRPAGEAHYATGAMRTPMRFDVTAYAAPVTRGKGRATETWDELRRKGAPRARKD